MDMVVTKLPRAPEVPAFGGLYHRNLVSELYKKAKLLQAELCNVN